MQNDIQSGFYIDTDKSRLDLGMIIDFLSHRSYWATGRNPETIRRSIENSLCFGVFSAEDRQVGFARVVTDYALKRWGLGTTDAHGLYAQFGFRALDKPETMMEKEV
jgi:hypothetical protein